MNPWSIAEGIVLFVVTNILGKGVKAVVRQCRYMCCLKQFEEEMNEEERVVSGLRDVLDKQLEEEWRNTKTPHKIVGNWMTDSEEAMNEVHSLKTAIEKIKGDRCFKNSWCPNCFWQYNQSKKVDHLVETLRNLKNRRAELPQELTYEADTPNVESILDGFMSSDSSKLALDEIMMALQTDDVKMIGLHGMPGVGKTTLAKKVIEEAKERRIFNEYVMITVTRKPDIWSIQARLAGIMGVKIKGRSDQKQNAGRLMLRMKDENKKLVVIDNLWEELNLIEIGFPPIRELKKCKVLLTTRSVQVCIGMNCQRRIALNTLTEEDGWALFKYAANLKDGVETNLTKQVARECCGLPLAIMSVGKTLREKTGENAWIRALEKLKGGEVEDIQGISKEENPYRSIKFSFDELGEKGKAFLVLCALFPEDYGIFLDQFAKYAIGLCQYPMSFFDEALSETIERIDELKDLHLLLGFDIKEERKGVFQMHDLIRDVVRKIGRMSYLDTGDYSRAVVEGYLANTSFTNIPNVEVEAHNLSGNLYKLSNKAKKWMLLCYLYVKGEDEEICVMELCGYGYRMGMNQLFEDAMADLLGAIDESKRNHFLLAPTRDRHIKFHPEWKGVAEVLTFLSF